MQQRVNAIDQDISRSVKTDPSMHELGLFCLVKIARLVTLLFLGLSVEIVGGVGVRLQLLRQFDISFLARRSTPLVQRPSSHRDFTET